MQYGALLAAVAAVLLAHEPAPVRAQQMMRFSCSKLVIERLDPLVSPGEAQSPHLHQIGGGNSFRASMPSGAGGEEEGAEGGKEEEEEEFFDPVAESTCTSCSFAEDFSNYWTANLFFRARNGSLLRVPQLANMGLSADGGLTVYYIPPYRDEKTKVTAFKPVRFTHPSVLPYRVLSLLLSVHALMYMFRFGPIANKPPLTNQGFRMLVGDSTLRQAEGQQRQLCHRCFATVNQVPFGGAPCTGEDTAALPAGMCRGGIRTTITFPTCWDGVHVDSPDHKAHVAYPETGTFESGGPCPASHPVKLPQLMYEVIWDTRRFNDPDLWPEDGSQPFVYSMGDG